MRPVPEQVSDFQRHQNWLEMLAQVGSRQAGMVPKNRADQLQGLVQVLLLLLEHGQEVLVE